MNVRKETHHKMLMGIKLIFLAIWGSECTAFIKQSYYKLMTAKELNDWIEIAGFLNSATLLIYQRFLLFL